MMMGASILNIGKKLITQVFFYWHACMVKDFEINMHDWRGQDNKWRMNQPTNRPTNQSTNIEQTQHLWSGYERTTCFVKNTNCFNEPVAHRDFGGFTMLSDLHRDALWLEGEEEKWIPQLNDTNLYTFKEIYIYKYIFTEKKLTF